MGTVTMGAALLPQVDPMQSVFLRSLILIEVANLIPCSENYKLFGGDAFSF
jgi:hypothetical protein